jgi:NIMA (never in mitosis gene a)-related kinase
MNDFQVLATLGSGSFSEVFKVKRLTDGSLYAMKKVTLPLLSQREQQLALNEVRILASVRNEHVISYK